MEEIEAFMTDQFDPSRFVVCERLKFWSKMKRGPGETIPRVCSTYPSGRQYVGFSVLRTLSTKLFQHVLFVQSATKRS